MKSEAGTRTKRVPSLDGLRAFSVAFVIFDHLCISGYLPVQQHWIDVGNLGVRIFFVISGFIITHLLLEELRSSGSISLRNFYIRRFFRIVPIWACFVAVILFGLWRLHSFPDPLRLLALFTYNVDYFPPAAVDFQHLWSLSVEEKFYLLWPFTLFALGKRGGARVALGAVLVVPIIRYVGATHGSTYFQLLWRFQNTADAIATGCLLAFAWEWIKKRSNVETARWLSSPYVTIVAIAGIIGTAPPGPALGNFYYLVGPTIVNLLIALVIYGVVANAGSFIGVLLNRPALQMVGLWSYGIYIWQQPFILHRKLGIVGIFPINVAVLMLVAVAGYYLIERRAQAYGRRITATNRNNAASAKRAVVAST